jgi:hypothetical protein
MPVNPRLYAEFRSDGSKLHRIDLFQDGWGGSAYETNVDGNGFELSYQTNGGRFATTVPSKCDVGFYIKNSDHQLVLNALVAEKDEAKWTLVISDDNGLVWAGQVITEGLVREDQAYPYLLKVTAVDGLKILADKAYVPQIAEGEKTDVLSVLLEILRTTPVNRAVVTDDYTPLVSLCVHWLAQGDKFRELWIPYWSLVTVDDKGKIFPKTCFEILESLLRAIGARIWLGQIDEVIQGWQIAQLDYLEDTTAVWESYELDGTPASSSDLSLDIPINQTSAQARLAGGSWSWDPALRGVKVKYKHTTFINYLAGVTATDNTSTYVPVQNVTLNEDVSTLRISGRITGQINNIALSATVPVTLVFAVFVSFGSGVTLRRDYAVQVGYSITYGPVGWAGGYYHVALPYVLPNGTGQATQFDLPFSILTPPVPSEGGEVQFDLNLVNIVTANGVVVPGAQATATWQLQDPTLLVLYGGNDTVLSDETVSEIVNTDASESAETITVDVVWGDGPTPNSRGTFFRETGIGVYTKTESWTRPPGAGTATLARQLAYAMLEQRRVPRARYNGTIWMDVPFAISPIIDGVRYLPARAKYNANQEHWEGEWFEVAKTTGGVDPKDPVDIWDGDIITLPPDPELDGLVVGPGTLDVLDAISINTVKDIIADGAVTTVVLTNEFAGDLLFAGQELVIVNPINGNTLTVTLTADVAEGDDTISVTGTATDGFPENSFVIIPNQTVFSNGGANTQGFFEKVYDASADTAGMKVNYRGFGSGVLTYSRTDNAINLQAPATMRLVSVSVEIPAALDAAMFGPGGPQVKIDQLGGSMPLNSVSALYREVDTNVWQQVTHNDMTTLLTKTSSRNQTVFFSTFGPPLGTGKTLVTINLN